MKKSSRVKLFLILGFVFVIFTDIAGLAEVAIMISGLMVFCYFIKMFIVGVMPRKRK